MIKLRPEHVVIAAGWLGFLPACSKDEAQSQSQSPAPGASVGDEAPPDQSAVATQQSTGAMPNPAMIGSDSQVAMIVSTVDSGEIEQAQLAQSRAKNARVQSFAQQMIQDHTSSKSKGGQLMQQAGLMPEASDTSRTLESQGMQTLQELKNADAASFDATYMRAQVKQHRDVLNMLTDQLIPVAKNSDLKSQLVTMRSLVQHHLEMAMGIQQELQGQPPMH